MKTITINEKWCKKCGICAAFCPKKVFDRDEDGRPVAARPEDKPDRNDIARQQQQKRPQKAGHKERAMTYALPHIQFRVKKMMPRVGEHQQARNDRAGENQRPKPAG